LLLGGDEMGRSQGGNNNAWCQDNEISWHDWDGADWELHAFTKRVIGLRLNQPVFRRRDYLLGDASRSGVSDVLWFRPDGEAMSDDDWQRDDAHALTVFLNGDEIPTHTRAGERIRGDSFLLLLNGHYEPLEFTIPSHEIGERWQEQLSTSQRSPRSEQIAAGDKIPLEERSVLVLRRI
jgi:glycogen operon protein